MVSDPCARSRREITDCIGRGGYVRMILSLIFPYYRNPGQLALHYAEMTRWSEKAKAQIEFVIVDDVSPEPAVDVERPDGLPALRIFPLLDDRPCFQNASLNIPSHHAKRLWLFSSSILPFLLLLFLPSFFSLFIF